MENNNEDKIKSILDHKNNGEILFMTEEGVMEAKMKDIIKQPSEGVLYDLNRDLATLMTNARTSKNLRWVNDIALANLFEYVHKNYNELKEKYEELVTDYKVLQNKYEDLKVEYGQFAKDPFNDPRSKYNYDTRPIPTSSKPTVEVTNKNAGKILPGFNDQLNICL